MNEQMEENEYIGRGELLGLIFFIIQNSSHLRELKNCIEGEFLGILKGIYEFFKFILCCYNILNIKNI